MNMTFDICSKFVGPMPLDVFLHEFVPDAPAPRPAGDFLFSKTSVTKNEDEFIEAIQGSGICPDLRFMNTTSRPRKKYLLKPHISVYSSDQSQVAEHHWGTIELWIESKPKKKDPFRQIAAVQTEKKDKAFRHGWSIRAYKTCDLLISYAAALHRSQSRVFSFSVVLFEDTARLVRWDRGGAIYTEAFKWADGDLFEFLWRFNHLSLTDRGYDNTVWSAEDDEAEAALPTLRTHPGFEDVRREHLHRIHVWDDHALDDAPRYYITPSPKWASDSLFGRATFGYVAYDIESGGLVYLKDFWRVDHPAVQKEGDVYRKLHEAQVPNIAKLGRAGDVCMLADDDQALVSVGAQKTETQDYVNHSWCPGRPRVEPYVHYRLVLETVGKPLKRFKSTRQLCEVIRDAVVAHTAAYEKARILHRDISAGNILITEEGTGLLIDWDLSTKVKEYKDVDTKPRRHSRTGTWQFMSVARLVDPWSRPHELSDDLESFFWVLMYEVVRYRNDQFRGLLEGIRQVFDQQSESDKAGMVWGGCGKLTCLANARFSQRTIEYLVHTPCSAITEEMRSLFNDLGRYTAEWNLLSPQSRSKVEEWRNRDPRVQCAREKLRTSDAFLAILEKHLGSEWVIDDDASLELTDPDGIRRRKLEEGDSGINIHIRRIGRMPPKSTSSSDWRSSQTSSACYSMIPSSDPDSFMSTESSNDGPPAKQ